MPPEIRLFNEDCMPAMRRMKDKQYQLALVDPPYGIGMDGGSIGKNNFTIKRWDRQIPSKLYFEELKRVSINFICWGGNYFTDHLPPISSWIYWDKMQDGWGHTFSSGELAYATLGGPMRQFVYKNQGNYIGFPMAITTKTKHPEEKKIHPTQKPVALYKWLLTNYAKPGDKILDTHGGSGSICIACHDLGFDLDWYEIDAEYFQAAKGRLERHQRQATISFTEKPSIVQEEIPI